MILTTLFRCLTVHFGTLSHLEMRFSLREVPKASRWLYNSAIHKENNAFHGNKDLIYPLNIQFFFKNCD